MISIKSTHRKANAVKYLKKTVKASQFNNADAIGAECVKALQENTPKNSGLTAESWSYRVIHKSDGKLVIEYLNSNIQNGVNVVLLINYGHVTVNGNWVEGANFIDPIVSEIYLKAIDKKWKEMKKL